MYDLTTFPLDQMTVCGARLRGLGEGAGTMEVAAQRIVEHLHAELSDGAGHRACALVRMYKTHAYGVLPGELQDFARRLMPNEALTAATKCLTLVATSGDDPAWRSRATSTGHKAIPLPSAQIVEQLPMVAQLVRQLGLEPSTMLAPRPDLMVDLEQRNYNVFHVAEALGSPFIPAQDGFVVPHKIRSVLGFGGMLPSGDLFAVIAFAKVPISRQVAELFRTIALNVKMAVLRFGEGAVFATS